jgi:hypothetical protein
MAVADLVTPKVTQDYTALLQSIRDLFASQAQMHDNTGIVGVMSGCIRWSGANSRFEKFNGSSWGALATTYSISLAGTQRLAAIQLGANEVYLYEDATNQATMRTGATGAFKYFQFGVDGVFRSAGFAASAPSTFTSASFSGALALAASSGVNQFLAGNGDLATYATHNVKLKLHYGLGLTSYDDVVRGVYDSRTGTWDTLGGFKQNGVACALVNGSVNYANSAGNVSSISGAVGGGYSWTGIQQFVSANGGGAYTFNNNGTRLQVVTNDGGGAYMTFLRNGSYAVNMGLDPDNIFRLGGWSAAANLFQIDMAGNLTMLNNVTAYSDERKKKNWRDVCDNFVEYLAEVKHGIFERIDTGNTQAGLSAQGVQRILPEVVMEDREGFLSVNYGAFSAVAVVKLAIRLLKEIQRNDALEKRIEVLESK